MALLVSCLYSMQARAGDVTVEFGTTALKSGSYPGTTAMNRDLVFNTNPKIKFSGKVSYTSSTSLLKFAGASGIGNTLTISTTDGTKMTKIVFNGYNPKSITTTSLTCATPASLTIGTNDLQWTCEDGSDTATLKLTSSTRNFQFSGVTITLADGGGTPSPTLTVNQTKIDAGYMDIPYTGEIKLTGANLTGDVTATSSNPEILKVSPAFCSKEEAEAGKVFEFTFTPTSETDAPIITFRSEGAQDVVVTSTAVGANFPKARVECDSITKLTQLGVGDEATYTGSDALVTYVYGDRIYVQDDEAAIRLTAAADVGVSSIQIGDKLANLAITRINTGWQLDSFGAANIASTGNEVDARVVTPDQLADNLFRVFSLQGLLLLDNASATEVAKLPAGLYIVNGKKVSIQN